MHPVIKLAGIEQEGRIRRPTKTFVAASERFVYQQSDFRHRLQKLGKQGAMQIIGDNDNIEFLASQRPFIRFNIRMHSNYPRNVLNASQCVDVSIERNDPVAQPRRQSRVTTGPARDVEHAGSRWHQL